METTLRTLGELTGLAVVGEGSGNKFGTVSDVLFEAGSGAITGFMVHPGGMFHKANLLPRASVSNLGADVLMILPSHVLQEAAADPAVPGSLSAKSLEGRPVIDDKGTYLGKISEVVFAGETLSVAALRYSTGVVASLLHKQPTIAYPLVKAIGADSVVLPAAEAAPVESESPAAS